MTDEELAALAVAVAAAAQRTAAQPEAERMPAWRRAMREESVQSGV